MTEQTPNIEQTILPKNGLNTLEGLNTPSDDGFEPAPEENNSSKPVSHDEALNLLNEALEEEFAEELEPTTEPAKEPTEDKHKIKVFGKELEVTTDDLKKFAQIGLASKDKLAQLKKQEAAYRAQAQQIQQLGQALRSGNPDIISSIFKASGTDFDRIVMERARHIVNESKMTPQQREALAVQRQRQALEQQQRMLQQQQQQMTLAQTRNQLKQQAEQALTKVGLDPSPDNIASMATVLQGAHAANKRPTMEQVAEYVKRTREEHLRKLATEAPVDVIKEYLGDRVNELVPQNKPQRKPEFVPRENKRKPKGYIKNSEYQAEKKKLGLF